MSLYSGGGVERGGGVLVIGKNLHLRFEGVGVFSKRQKHIAYTVVIVG